jgi:hypothetical protein
MSKEEFASKKISIETESVVLRMLVGSELDDISAFSEEEKVAIEDYKKTGNIEKLEAAAVPIAEKSTAIIQSTKKIGSIQEYWYDQYDIVKSKVEQIKSNENIKNEEKKDNH